MNCSPVVFTDAEGFKTAKADGSLRQVRNTAMLPGAVSVSAMPDIHHGYGMPIGGVLATGGSDACISPGAVGYDINCGVRYYSFNISKEDAQSFMPDLVKSLYRAVPSGVGKGGDIHLNAKEIHKLLSMGAKWSVQAGYGTEADLESVESAGRLDFADSSKVSELALKRGADQLGTLGSGNHFVEIGYIDEVYDEPTAELWGLKKGQLGMMIHTGSRGLGHQVCTDYSRSFKKAVKKYNIDIPDIQLACAPVSAQESKDYLGAMGCAANFAWANRQVIGSLALQAVSDSLGGVQSNLLYDLAHNILKFEEHNGMKLAVHRKGATRAFSAGHIELSGVYKKTGQPVIVPGDMGRCSFIMKGGEKSMELSLGSACHGAGRKLSRKEAVRNARGRNIAAELSAQGVHVMAADKMSLFEEMPEAYKDVQVVADIVSGLKIAEKVVKLKPLCVIKG